MEMNARALEAEAECLSRKRRRSIECAALAIACGVLVPFAWELSARLGVAVIVGAAVQAMLSVVAYVTRRDRLEELALDPSAYVIPDVRAFGAWLARPRQRRLLARALASLIKDAMRPGNFFLGDRVLRYGRELETIARDLLSPAVRVQPAAAATCRWLLTHGAESPLYDPKLPAEDLGSMLYRILAGMSPAGPTR
jgi:hypothetical protein